MTELERDAGLQILSVTDPEELKAVQELAGALERIDPLLTRWARVASVKAKPTSQIGVDDEFTAWRYMSHTITGAINLALDNLRAVRDLIKDGDKITLPQFAHFSLIRSALEASSLALWILEPDDPRERIERQLRAAASELFEELALRKQAVDAWASDPSGHLTPAMIDRARKENKEYQRKHSSNLAVVASRVGLPSPNSGRRGIGYAEMVRVATASTGVKGYHGESIWRMISGLTHPSLLRALSRSRIEELNDNGDGTFYGLVTTDIGLTQTALQAATLNTRNAIEIFGHRKIHLADRDAYLAP